MPFVRQKGISEKEPVRNGEIKAFVYDADTALYRKNEIAGQCRKADDRGDIDARECIRRAFAR